MPYDLYYPTTPIIHATYMPASPAVPVVSVVEVPSIPAFPSGAVVYWKMEEATGTNRVDSIGTCHLTDVTNVVDQIAGKQGYAASFSGGDKRLQAVDAPAISVSDIDFTWAGWVKHTDATSTQNILYKGEGSFAQHWAYYIYLASNNYSFSVTTAGPTVGTVTATTFGTPVSGIWYFLACVHDSVNDLLKISINNGAFDTLSYASGSHDEANNLRVGFGPSPSINTLKGAMDEWGLWKRVLTAQEISDLYNSGQGNYPH